MWHKYIHAGKAFSHAHKINVLIYKYFLVLSESRHYNFKTWKAEHMELWFFDFRKGKPSHLLLNHYLCLICLLTQGCRVAIKRLADGGITRTLQMMRLFGLSLWVPGEILTCVHLLFFWCLRDRICRMWFIRRNQIIKSFQPRWAAKCRPASCKLSKPGWVFPKGRWEKEPRRSALKGGSDRRTGCPQEDLPSLLCRSPNLRFNSGGGGG